MIHQKTIKDRINEYFVQIQKNEMLEELKMDSNAGTKLKASTKRTK